MDINGLMENANNVIAHMLMLSSGVITVQLLLGWQLDLTIHPLDPLPLQVQQHQEALLQDQQLLEVFNIDALKTSN